MQLLDWRYRDGWRRRCRLVAREFNVSGETTSETSSPTSTIAAMRMLLVLAMGKRLHLVAFDVKDAFLTVGIDSGTVVEVFASPTKCCHEMVRQVPISSNMASSRSLVSYGGTPYSCWRVSGLLSQMLVPHQKCDDGKALVRKDDTHKSM